MTTANIVLFGASGHAKVIVDMIERADRYRVVGFVDTYKPAGTEVFGLRVLGSESDLNALIAEHDLVGGIVAIGDNWIRHLVTGRVRSLVPDFEFVSAVHPSAQIARGVAIGPGSVIMAGAVVNSDSVVGEGCIVNTKASLDHDGVMGAFSSLAPGATCGGNVTIGTFSAVSQGANVIHGRSIGAHTVIGAGSLVLADMPDYCLAYGIPARVIRPRAEGERYL